MSADKTSTRVQRNSILEVDAVQLHIYLFIYLGIHYFDLDVS